MRTLAAALCLLALAQRANAEVEPPVCPLSVAERVAVSTVVDGASFKVIDGRNVRLAAIHAPMMSLGRSNVEDQPLAVEARGRLASLILNRTVGLAFDERGTDRHGDVVAHVVLEGPRPWLQARLVGDGLARVLTQSDSRKCANALLMYEDQARRAQRGLWAHLFYIVRPPEGLDDSIGTFRIVEGRICISAVERRDRIFLNFGPDYRTDFTVAISPRDARRMRKNGTDPLAWNAKRVRVRGWISLLNGPEIELTHAEQIEVLD